MSVTIQFLIKFKREI